MMFYTVFGFPFFQMNTYLLYPVYLVFYIPSTEFFPPDSPLEIFISSQYLQKHEA